MKIGDRFNVFEVLPEGERYPGLASGQHVVAICDFIDSLIKVNSIYGGCRLVIDDFLEDYGSPRDCKKVGTLVITKIKPQIGDRVKVIKPAEWLESFIGKECEVEKILSRDNLYQLKGCIHSFYLHEIELITKQDENTKRKNY